MDAVSYDVITPMAARGILEAIHWTPAIRWRIERLVVGRRINPVLAVAVAGPTSQSFNPAASSNFPTVHLTDVEYLVEARLDVTAEAGPSDSADHHAELFRRRVREQRSLRPPYLGQRGFHATISLAEEDEPASSFYAGSGAVDLGWMIYDRHPQRDRGLLFYRPVMVDGVIDLTAIGPRDLVG